MSCCAELLALYYCCTFTSSSKCHVYCTSNI